MGRLLRVAVLASTLATGALTVTANAGTANPANRNVRTHLNATQTPSLRAKVAVAVDSVAARTAPGSKAERWANSFSVDGKAYATVLDVLQTPHVGSQARVTVIQVAPRVRVLKQADGTALVGASRADQVKEDPGPPFRRHEDGKTYICTPAYTYTHPDEECEARKEAAHAAVLAICVVGFGVSVFIPGSAVVMFLACEAAHQAFDQIHCNPIVVLVPEFCRRLYPEQTDPAVEKYHEQTGQNPPDPCDSRRAMLAVAGDVKHPPICE
jgi:hypothetical protein